MTKPLANDVFHAIMGTTRASALTSAASGPATTGDQTAEITRAVAEEIGCPSWLRTKCEDGECYCRNAAERVLRVAR